ncbi:MAG: alpha-amylase/4-alpha-glucanotransferase domain-containing protein [Candidatus Omnitrophota bacterium]
MAIHSHQPVGNFDHIFEIAFNNAYLPFLDVLERHPRIRISLHYSGSLLDWIENKRPDFIERIKKLVERKQIEILSAGYYEPILILLPERDRIGQIKLLNEKIYRIWSFKPKGAWLTERVWEPDLPKTLQEAEIIYTIVDDTHFEKAGKMREELWGYYITEYDNRLVRVFPGSKFLRYALPFKLPAETIEYLKRAFGSGRKAITFADDGEKFGLWPGTFKWVYEEKWLEHFFQAIEDNSDWLELITFSEYIENFPPTGRVYLPCTSYDEMQEWADGYFRNFLAKYPEANHMHKRMMEVSGKVQSVKCKAQSGEFEEAKRHLYMAQNNDSYWHGVFGGLYLNHLRHSIYNNLIKTENIIDRANGERNKLIECTVNDFDCDGSEEVIITNRLLKLYLDIEENAGIYEIDDREKKVNLVNTISRRKEKYHEKIKEKIIKNNPGCSHNINQGSVSIHDIEKTIPREWEGMLSVYDSSRKGCLLEYFLHNELTREKFLRKEYKEREFIERNYVIDAVDKSSSSVSIELSKKVLLDGLPFGVKKILRLESDSRVVSCEYIIVNKSTTKWDGKFGVEFNFSLWDNILSSEGEKDKIDNLLIKDSWFEIEIEIKWDKQGGLWHFPVETIYETESGFEKNYQELGLIFLWSVMLMPEQTWKIKGSFEVK